MIDTEKAALCARIDDLCAEVERLKQQNAMLRELENIRISQVKFCEDLDAENSKLQDERERLFHANVEKNGEVLRLVSENTKLRKLVTLMYRDMQGVLDTRTDTVWVNDFCTLRDGMDYHMQAMAELGMPPADYERRMRELGIEVPE